MSLLERSKSQESSAIPRFAWPAAALAIIAGGMALFQLRGLEDAFITFRYARHLASGHPYGAWNLDGSLVDGSTSFLWTWWIALGFATGVSPIVTAALGSVLGLVTWLGIAASFKRRDGRDIVSQPIAAASVLFAVAYLPTQWYLSTGMEAIAFMGLAGATFFISLKDGRMATVGHAILAAALVALRPEGVVFALGGIVCAAIARLTPWRIFLARYGAVIACIVVASVALALFRYVQFGFWVPNPFFAKAGAITPHRLVLGLKYVWYFIDTHLAFVTVIVVALALGSWSLFVSERGRWFLSLVAFLGVYAAYVVYTGGDDFAAFPYWRHFIHAFAVVSMAVASAAFLVAGSVWAAATILLFVAGVTSAQIFTVGSPVDGGHGLSARIGPNRFPEPEGYYDVVRRLAGADTVIATSMAGRFPYSVDAVFVDMLGLNDTHIAHFGSSDPSGPVDSKTDGAYVLRRRPDILEPSMPATAIEARDLERIYAGRPKLVAEIVDDPTFQHEYCFLRDAPYGEVDRALFLRRAFAAAHKLGDGQCVPVANTVLKKPVP
jgi:arabinofuranosyltransferase